VKKKFSQKITRTKEERKRGKKQGKKKVRNSGAFFCLLRYIKYFNRIKEATGTVEYSLPF
jgi:hypothetical protein